MSPTLITRRCAVVVLLHCITLTAAFNGEFPAAVTPIAISSDDPLQCPADEDRLAARQVLQNRNYQIIQEYARPTINVNCGPGQWRRIFYLNASSSDQETSTCPSGWNTVSNSVRACRGVSSACASAFTDDITQPYSKVCGRVIGIGQNSPDSFYRFPGGRTI